VVLLEAASAEKMTSMATMMIENEVELYNSG